MQVLKHSVTNSNEQLHWQPSATFQQLQQRAKYLARIRDFFAQRAYLEVETPIMGKYGVTDLYLNNMTTYFREKIHYLQTSPEYFMKRLLAAGSGPIYQIARVFRDDELGRWHNPEFSLLEWYQLAVDHLYLIEEISIFFQGVCNWPPVIIYTYAEVFKLACGINPLVDSIAVLQNKLTEYNLHDVLLQDEVDRDQYLFLLMTHIVEPYLASLQAPVAVIDFPASQAALAQIVGNCAQRFEIYYQGVELANGFHELINWDEQQQRFADDRQKRRLHGLVDIAMDEQFLAALEHGLPACSGVALGLDRLLALVLQQPDIAAVQAFNYVNL